MLSPGTVIYLEILFPLPRGPRNKYVIVLEWASDVHCLIIDSEINPFFGHGVFKDYYVLIDQHTHRFLDYDSYIDCNQVWKLDVADTERELQEDEDCEKGTISNDVRQQIIEAISGTPGLAPFEKQRYIEILSK